MKAVSNTQPDVEKWHRSGRLVGHCTQNQSGPLLIAMGGIHGNEPAGLEALNRVFALLKQQNPAFKGHFWALAGNLEAIRHQTRFVSLDLNRQWHFDKIKYVTETPVNQLAHSEDRQQKELLEVFEYLLPQYGTNGAFMLDLHTTSAHGGAYCISTRFADGRRLGAKLGVPLILGMEQVLRGTTMNFFNDLHLPSFCFEAGQHNDPKSIDITEAALWVTLVNMNCLQKQDVNNYQYYKNLLAEAGKHLPNVVEFAHRHPVQPEDEFKMLPGYKNFQTVCQGEVLAHDRNGPIIAPCNGMMLMPLYQSQGEDGFFIVNKVEVGEE